MAQKSAYSYLEISNSIFHNIYPLFCGQQTCAPLYSFGPAVREYHLMHVCLEGEGVFHAGNYSYPIKKGQGFLIHPGELTFYQADEIHPWTYAWIGIAGEETEHYLAMAGLSKEHPVFSCPDTDYIQGLISDMQRHGTLSCSNEFYIQGLLMQYLSYLIAHGGVSQEKMQKTANVYINQAISYIHKNYQNPISVQEIADYLCLNRSYLTELFMKNVHFSPQQFLMKFRMTKATDFLLDTDYSIEHIAYSCGYSSIYSFSKAFKKITGKSPNQYRKEQQMPQDSHVRLVDPHKDERWKSL